MNFAAVRMGKKTTLRWMAKCSGRSRYEVIVFEPEGRDVSRTVVRAKSGQELIRRATELVNRQRCPSFRES